MSAVATGSYPASNRGAIGVDTSGATQRAIVISQRARECLGNARIIEERLAPRTDKTLAGVPGNPPVPTPDHIVFAQEDSDRTLVELNDTLARISGLL